MASAARLSPSPYIPIPVGTAPPRTGSGAVVIGFPPVADTIAPALPLSPPGSDGRFAAASDALSRWTYGASAGDRAIYARQVTVAACPVGRRANELFAMGLIKLHRMRASAGGLFDYIAVRTAVPIVAARAPVCEARLPMDDSLVLDLLEQLADDSLPCPSYADLAALAGLKGGVQRLHVVLRRLREGGYIQIHCLGQRAPFVAVTISDSGHSTAGGPR